MLRCWLKEVCCRQPSLLQRSPSLHTIDRPYSLVHTSCIATPKIHTRSTVLSTVPKRYIHCDKKKNVLCSSRRTFSSVCRITSHHRKHTRRVFVPFSSQMSRFMSSNGGEYKDGNRTVVIYVCAIGVLMVGLSYAGVPLYRMFCQATGFGGQAVRGHDTSKVETMEPIKERLIKVKFNADTASSMQWNFKPQQSEVNVLPGETALAFYTAKNPTSKPIIGISTYNVVPFEAGLYFNKIQCFCFEEQRLNPHEQVDMPVFFYIDPEFAEDPKLEHIDQITLSYTFFESKEGMNLPLPGYMRQQQPQ